MTTPVKLSELVEQIGWQNDEIEKYFHKTIK